jgi:hypothetical protein
MTHLGSIIPVDEPRQIRIDRVPTALGRVSV